MYAHNYMRNRAEIDFWLPNSIKLYNTGHIVVKAIARIISTENDAAIAICSSADAKCKSLATFGGMVGIKCACAVRVGVHAHLALCM